MPKLVYDFTEGNKDLKDLLGGKGANLAEMTNLGLPVPPGFTITTEACRHYLRDGRSSPRAWAPRSARTSPQLEKAMGRKLGDPADPLLVSVRSGAKFSMPGMMDTVLNIGLSDESVEGLAKQAGNERFAWDSYRPPDPDVRQDRAGHRRRALRARASTPRSRPRASSNDTRPGRRRPARPRRDVQGDRPRARRTWSSRRTRREQMNLAINAVFDSWNTDRAVLYRRQERIPADLGTAVNIVAMVFGNLGDGLGHRRRVHPRPGAPARRASTATTCRTRRARTSSPASATPCRCRTWSASTRPRTTS